MDDLIKYVDLSDILNEWEPCKKAIIDFGFKDKWQMDQGCDGAYLTFQHPTHDGGYNGTPVGNIIICPQNDIVYIDYMQKTITHKLSNFDIVKFKNEIHLKLNLIL